MQEQVTVNDRVVYKSRWGYYPCDYATFMKLKKLHRLALVSARCERKRERWEAKLPHNRVMTVDGVKVPQPEPAHCCTGLEYYHNILTVYKAARKPCEKPEDVVYPHITVNLEKDLVSLEMWVLSHMVKVK